MSISIFGNKEKEQELKCGQKDLEKVLYEGRTAVAKDLVKDEATVKTRHLEFKKLDKW